MSDTSAAPATVSALMRRHYIAVSAEDSLADVGRIMQSTRVRSLPVLRDDIVIGVISYRDIFETYRDALELPREKVERRLQELDRVSVEQAMKPVEEVILPSASAEEAAELLCKVPTGFLPVVAPEGGELRILGIITETDVLRAAYDPLGTGD